MNYVPPFKPFFDLSNNIQPEPIPINEPPLNELNAIARRLLLRSIIGSLAGLFLQAWKENPHAIGFDLAAVWSVELDLQKAILRASELLATHPTSFTDLPIYKALETLR